MTSEEETPKQESRTITISARDFISSPFVECPKCGKEAFGVLSIFSDSYTRRCKACLHPSRTDGSAVFSLPTLSKRIIYLDQVAISEMMKAIHPQTKDSRDRNAWRAMFERLDSLCKMHLVVCPESSFHHEESYVWKGYETLKRMYELLSGEVRFRAARSMKMHQILRHVALWLTVETDDVVDSERRDAIEGQVDAWLDTIRIGIKSDFVPEWADDLRRDRERSHDSMVSLFEAWQKQKDRRFEDWYKNEIGGFGPAVLRQHHDYLQVRQEILDGRRPMVLESLLPPLVSDFVQCVLRECGRHLTPPQNAVDAAREYFEKAEFSEVPFVRISSLLLAGLARRAASGQKRPPSRGMITDINMVSLVLPYCDAVFLDREMDSLLSERDVRDRLGCETAVFSARNFDSFFEYLDSIKETASDQLLDALGEVYGDRWSEPFVSMYDDEE